MTKALCPPSIPGSSGVNVSRIVGSPQTQPTHIYGYQDEVYAVGLLQAFGFSAAPMQPVRATFSRGLAPKAVQFAEVALTRSTAFSRT